MENTEAVIVTRSTTNPLLTIVLFLAIIFSVVFAGSHFSQRNSNARALEAALLDPVSAIRR